MKKQPLIKDTADSAGSYEVVYLKFEQSERPDFKPSYGLEYIKFGRDNNYPNFINKLYNESSKHQSIINGKCTYIYGKGIVSESDSVASNDFINRNKGLIKKCIFDIRNNGGCYIYAVPNKLNTAYSFTHIPFNRIRTNEDNSKFYYSPDFGKKRDAKAIEIPSFVQGVKQSSIIMYREHNGTNEDPYPFPDWYAALNWIESDIEVSKHTLTNAKTGFSASKFINFYNGKPTIEQKRNVTKQFKSEYGGSAGEKIVISFNDPDAKAPTIDDLGTSDLSKEDFQQVNDLISENIYAGHGITTPQLFGVPQKEGLGGDGQKLKTGYTIFNNTYVTSKQQELEDLFKMLAELNGIIDNFSFKQLDPIGIEFDTATITANLSRDEIRELLGFEKEQTDLNINDKVSKAINSLSPLVANKVLESMSVNEIRGLAGLGQSLDGNNIPIEPTTVTPIANSVDTNINSTLTNLTGRQRQNVMGIVRQFGQGKLTKLQASILLKNGYGFTDNDVNDFLGIDSDPLTQDAVKQAFSESEDDLILVFSQFGEAKDDYSKVLTKSAMIEVTQMFDVAEKELGIFSNVKSIAKKLPKFEVRYSYDKRDDVGGADLLPTSRPFCVKMIGLERMYSREDIQKISSVLGYDVFNRAGGFWNNNGVVEPHCRHEFKSHVVIKKN